MIILALIAGSTVGNLITYGLVRKDWSRAWGVSAINAVLLLSLFGALSLLGVNFNEHP